MSEPEDSSSITESELERFFRGLEGGIKSFNEVRLIYDENVEREGSRWKR